MLVVLLSMLFVWYGRYIELAKCTIPYSDYFQWTVAYGEKIINHEISMGDYFRSDNGEHIQPIMMLLSTKVLGATDFDYAVLVTAGMYIRCVMAAILAIYSYLILSKREEPFSEAVAVICAAIIAFACLNFNQWEMVTESFALGSSIRVLIYFASFLLADYWIQQIPKHSAKQNTFWGGLFGVVLSCTTLLISAGYFVGHVLSIGFVFLFVLLKNINNMRQYLIPMVTWGITTLAGCIIYVLILVSGTRQDSVSISLDLLSIILGLIVFWGAAFLPIVLLPEIYGLVPYAVIGTLVIFVMTFLIFKHLRKREAPQLFPVFCIIYANLAAIIIATARISTFSYSTMTSSRYTIESTIGIIGVIWLLANYLTEHCKLSMKVWASMGILSITALLSISANYEMQRAPYIRNYYDNLELQLLEYESCSDETLEMISATSPEKARLCLNFLKEHHLSIFGDNE